MLKYEEKTYKCIDYNDVDKVINDFYKPNNRFEFLCDNESPNDVYFVYDIDGKISEYEEKELENFLQGKYLSYMSCTLLNDLCRKNLIPKGEYLIEASW